MFARRELYPQHILGFDPVLRGLSLERARRGPFDVVRCIARGRHGGSYGGVGVGEREHRRVESGKRSFQFHRGGGVNVEDVGVIVHGTWTRRAGPERGLRRVRRRHVLVGRDRGKRPVLLGFAFLVSSLGRYLRTLKLRAELRAVLRDRRRVVREREQVPRAYGSLRECIRRVGPSLERGSLGEWRGCLQKLRGFRDGACLGRDESLDLPRLFTVDEEARGAVAAVRGRDRVDELGELGSGRRSRDRREHGGREPVSLRGPGESLPREVTLPQRDVPPTQRRRAVLVHRGGCPRQRRRRRPRRHGRDAPAPARGWV